MADHPDRESAVLFGMVTANISHEIKNSLAIIKEIAGLQSDLLALAAKGRPLEPERLDSLAGRITNQVSKADTIVKRMNRFAHTVDCQKKTVDMGEEIGFIIRLMDRLFQMKGILLQADVPDKPLQIETDPFRFVAAVIACMQIFMGCIGKGTELTLHVVPIDHGATVGFSSNDDGMDLPSTCQATVGHAMEGLGAEYRIPGEKFPMELVFPSMMT